MNRCGKAFLGTWGFKVYFLVSFFCVRANSIAGYLSKSMASGESLYNKNNAVYRFLSSSFFLFVVFSFLLQRHSSPVDNRCRAPKLSSPGGSHLIRSSPRYNNPFADILYRFQSPSSTAARRSTRLRFRSPNPRSSAVWDPTVSPALRIPRTLLRSPMLPNVLIAPIASVAPIAPMGPANNNNSENSIF